MIIQYCFPSTNVSYGTMSIPAWLLLLYYQWKVLILITTKIKNTIVKYILQGLDCLFRLPIRPRVVCSIVVQSRT